MNFVLIMTDTQNRDQVGAYGHPRVDTPNLDRLAAEGIRFDRAYTTCPLCTPARGGIFTGLHPQLNGAWCNNVAPHAHVALLGTIFRHYGYRAAYTGKWHLDGTAYFGNGQPDGGFEPDWWYDGKRYAEEIGPDLFRKYRTCRDAEDLRRAGFTEEQIWGHRVANRALDFLGTVGEQPFLLVCSFDEPHGPCVAPPEYWEKSQPNDYPYRPNFNAPLEGKPALQQVHRQQRGEHSWEEVSHSTHARKWFGCNSYIDREIGRVLQAVDRWHPDDTVVIYTSDHGDQFGSHGLGSKGPMMYEETCNVPFLVRAPGGPRGAVSAALLSQVDLLPTLLDLAGLARPEVLNGASFRTVLEEPCRPHRDYALLNYHRFAINHDDYGEFYPIRCVTDGRYKLAINLLDTDEFYDLAEDPYEVRNLIQEPGTAAERDRLHDWLLGEMDRIRDPFRSFHWGHRAWRRARQRFYTGGARRNRPPGFPFQAGSLEAG